MNRELLVEKLTAEKFKKFGDVVEPKDNPCLLYTSDAADDTP